jgi:DNA-binding MarR family transcriptional regulator
VEKDFLRELEFLGVTARLKRLSDGLTASIKELYREAGVDIEPSWHLVLLFLEERSATLTEIAEALHLSQPAMTKMINRMVARGYLDVVRDVDDSRKKNIRLSARARERLPLFKEIWAAGQAAVREILGSDRAFLHHLERFESRVGERSLADRARARFVREG